MVVGDVVDAYGTPAYGTPAYGTPTSPFGYSGQYTDPTTGLVNDRARMYQPGTGGFTSRDPAFSSTDTAYTYAGQDPVNNSDPSGLSWYDPSWVNSAASSVSGAATCAYNWAANNSAVTWFNQNINPVYGVLNSARGFINCNASFGTCFNENINPAYGILVTGQSAWDGWSDPCVSGWDEFGRILNVGRSVVATAGVADGIRVAGTSVAARLGSVDWSDETGSVSWPSAGHADQLPQGGDFPYEPPGGANSSPVNLGRGQGFRDAAGNLWQWARPTVQHGGPHWDVQLKGGGYVNVSPDGKIL